MITRYAENAILESKMPKVAKKYVIAIIFNDICKMS